MFIRDKDIAIPVTALRTSAVFYAFGEDVAKPDDFSYNSKAFDEFGIQRYINDAIGADLDIATRFIDIGACSDSGV
jgi:hypothetical protein